jgi:hypothetical protein
MRHRKVLGLGAVGLAVSISGACSSSNGAAGNGDAGANDATSSSSTGSSSGSGRVIDAGGRRDADAAEATGVDASMDGGTCVEAPTLGPSDLSCDSDQNCATVWTGTFCPCGCNCPTAPGNTAAYTRVGAALGSVLNASTCSEPCECPALGIPRCFSHQCALCGNMGVVVKNQPAACDADAAGGDGGD